VPAANAVWAGDRMLQLKPSDVAVAVAIEGGLFTPVLKDASMKSLSALSAEMKDLATRARDRKLAPHEYQGGSFAISNLGMFGIDNFDAVINPPHGAILAVGAGVKKPVVGADGELDRRDGDVRHAFRSITASSTARSGPSCCRRSSRQPREPDGDAGLRIDRGTETSRA
jgi:pyruvate/2-oxoglutarate dehydrogenase complex dihydrolipoamide acyltransferase (E2) component